MNQVIAIWLAVICFACTKAPAQERTFALANITIIDATGARPQSNMTVVVTGQRIAAVRESANVQIPPNTRVIDMRGRFLMPGMWDMHVHLSKAGENTLPLFIANGVTSVRDMGGDFEMMADWRKAIREGKMVGPRIKTSGPILEAQTNVDRMKREATIEPVDRFRVGVADPASAEAVVERMARTGVDFLKIRTVASADTYRAIATAARKHGLSIVGHAAVAPEAILEAGQRSIEHGFFPPLIDRSIEDRRELFRKLATNGTAIVPTLVTGEALRIPYERAKALAEDSDGNLDARRQCLSGYLIEDWREQVEEKKDYPPGFLKLLDEQRCDVREMIQAGMRVMAGTDVAVLLIWPGYSLHDELRLLVDDAGLTPMEAIISATRSPAEFFGMDGSLGTIQEGKIADLVVLEANPLDDIRNTRSITAVVSNGRLFAKTEIQEMLAECAMRARKENRDSRK